MTTPWTPAERLLCQTLTEQGRDSAEIARVFAEQGIQRTQKAIQRLKAREHWHGKVAESPVKALPVALTATGDMVIFPDPHCPFHDSAWCNRVMELALKMGVNQAGIPGDLIDWAAFSVYGRRIGVEAEDEIAAAEQFVRALSVSFDRVYCAPGNHERRLARAVGYALELDRLAEWWARRPNVLTTRNLWFWLDSGGRRFRVVHAANYSRAAPANSVRLCAKYRCSILGTHSHHWGIAQDVSGNDVGVDLGMCASAKLMDYVEEQSTNNPAQVTGAGIVKDGAVLLLSPANIGLYERLVA